MIQHSFCVDVYRKWNQNLFEELYVAYLNGRMETDPVRSLTCIAESLAGMIHSRISVSTVLLLCYLFQGTFWYKGEFGFFDFYIIPLTKKLKECGVFGVSSDEYLNYAMKNCQEWEARGQEVVAEMIEECHKKYGVKGSINLVEESCESSFMEDSCEEEIYTNEIDV